MAVDGFHVLHYVTDIENLLQDIEIKELLPLHTGAFCPLLYIEHTSTGNKSTREINTCLYTVRAQYLPYFCGYNVTEETAVKKLFSEFFSYAITLKTVLLHKQLEGKWLIVEALEKPDKHDFNEVCQKKLWDEVCALMYLMHEYVLEINIESEEDIPRVITDYYTGNLLTPNVLLDGVFKSYAKLLRQFLWKDFPWYELDCLWNTMTLHGLLPGANESIYKPIYTTSYFEKRKSMILEIRLHTGLEVNYSQEADKYTLLDGKFKTDSINTTRIVDYCDGRDPLITQAAQHVMIKNFQVPENIAFVAMHTQHMRVLAQNLLALSKQVKVSYDQLANCLKKPGDDTETICGNLSRIYKRAFFFDFQHATAHQTSSKISYNSQGSIVSVGLPFLRYSDTESYGKVNLNKAVTSVIPGFKRYDNKDLANTLKKDYGITTRKNNSSESSFRIVGVWSPKNVSEFTEYGNYKGRTTFDNEYGTFMKTEIMENGKCVHKYVVQIVAEGHGALGQACAYRLLLLSHYTTLLVQALSGSDTNKSMEVINKIYPHSDKMISTIIEMFEERLKTNNLFIKFSVIKDQDTTQSLNVFTHLTVATNKCKASSFVPFVQSGVPSFTERAQQYVFCRDLPVNKFTGTFKRIVEENDIKEVLEEVVESNQNGMVLLPRYHTASNVVHSAGSIVGDTNFIYGRVSFPAQFMYSKTTNGNHCRIALQPKIYMQHCYYDVCLDKVDTEYVDGVFSDKFYGFSGEDDIITDKNVEQYVSNIQIMGGIVSISEINAQGFNKEQYNVCLELFQLNDIEPIQDVEQKFVDKAASTPASTTPIKRKKKDAPVQKKRLRYYEEDDFYNDS
uniref:Uncharacterized protein n=1 Tax=Ranid herpesvirus 4 TaxID=2849006 RepID=A0A8F3HT01_9VIRU|nr:MAG: hypothetical protein [Ranid herpesvirus 4]